MNAHSHRAPSETPRPYYLQHWQDGIRPPEGWDVADAVEDGWTADDVTAWMRATVCDKLPAWWGDLAVGNAPAEPPDEPEVPPEPEPPEPAPPPFAEPSDDVGLTEMLARVRGDIDRAGADDLSTWAKPDVTGGALPALIREWVFLAGRGVFRSLDTGADMKVEAFNLAHQAIIPEVDCTVAGRLLKTPKEVRASEYLLSYRGGLRVQNTLYLPHLASEGPVVEVDGISYLNSYLPRYVPRCASVYVGHWAVEVWETHLRTILPDDWELLLTWLAYNAQHPGRKILWAPIVKGTQGDGKTTISKMLGAVMGARNVRVVSTESLFSDFTGYAEGACVAFLEEIRVKGHNRHDAMNKLKPLVTNEVIEVVRKGENGRNVPNVTNYLAFTNFEDALVLDDNDRRWGVFFTRFENRQALAQAGLDSDYFDRLHLAAEKHAGVLRAWLLAVDTSQFNPKSAPPLTSAKAAMIASSISPDAAMVSELVSLGRFGVALHAAATDCVNLALKAEQGTLLPTSRMAAAFTEIGWRPLDVQLKWKGKARRVYVDKSVNWPADDNRLRYAVREMLDATEQTDAIDPNRDPLSPNNW